MTGMEDLFKRKCVPCEGGTKPLDRATAENYLKDLPGWELKDPSSASGQASSPLGASPSAQGSGGQAGPALRQGSGQGNWIEKTYNYKNYYQVMAFVNAVAFMAHQQDHHPDLEVGYKSCKVKYTTHAINGLSENDFICAAKVEQLFK